MFGKILPNLRSFPQYVDLLNLDSVVSRRFNQLPLDFGRQIFQKLSLSYCHLLPKLSSHGRNHERPLARPAFWFADAR
jgi:hypothetical protein